MKIIPSATAKEAESRTATPKKTRTQKPKKAANKPKPSRNAKTEALRIAKELAAKDGISLKPAASMSDAERRAKRRSKYVAKSFELSPQAAAELKILAARTGQSEVAVIHELILGAYSSSSENRA